MAEEKKAKEHKAKRGEANFEAFSSAVAKAREMRLKTLEAVKTSSELAAALIAEMLPAPEAGAVDEQPWRRVRRAVLAAGREGADPAAVLGLAISTKAPEPGGRFSSFGGDGPLPRSVLEELSKICQEAGIEVPEPKRPAGLPRA